jgi:hypothetical protein
MYKKNINTLTYNLKPARVVTRNLPPYGRRDILPISELDSRESADSNQNITQDPIHVA